MDWPASGTAQQKPDFRWKPASSHSFDRKGGEGQQRDFQSVAAAGHLHPDSLMNGTLFHASFATNGDATRMRKSCFCLDAVTVTRIWENVSNVVPLGSARGRRNRLSNVCGDPKNGTCLHAQRLACLFQCIDARRDNVVVTLAQWKSSAC